MGVVLGTRISLSAGLVLALSVGWSSPVQAVAAGPVPSVLATLPQRTVDPVSTIWYRLADPAERQRPVVLAKGPIVLQRKERAGRPLGQPRILTPGDVQGFSGTGVPSGTPTAPDAPPPAGSSHPAAVPTDQPVIYHLDFVPPDESIPPPEGGQDMPPNSELP